MTAPESPASGIEDSSGFLSNTASPTQAWDASGLFGSSANLIYDGFTGDWGALSGDVLGVGMDLLGYAMDPLGSVLSGVLGWLIEHISFLKEGLDLLAGDPDAVNAMANTWSDIAEQLQQTAEKYSGALAALDGCQGTAVAAYRASVDNFAKVVAGGADHAKSAATAMTAAADVAGVVRGAIRDAITQFCSDAIIKFAAASALAPVTFGGSEAAFIADEVAEGATLAGENAAKVSKVVTKLEKVAKDAKQSRGAMIGSSKKLKEATRAYHKTLALQTGKSAKAVKEAANGANRADKLAKLGDQGDRLKSYRKELGDDLGKGKKEAYQDKFGSTNPTLEKIQDHMEREVEVKLGGHTFTTSAPKAPAIAGDLFVQATSDQAHRDEDAEPGHEERVKQWQDHWAEQRRTAAEPGSDGPWRTHGTL
ncbi:hypothetical protein [Actinokineospora inagensis]|uniref:hypothetical protein n=1 Tax=Actinokineospora inagensis TaxID=103730 RepID=UPI000419B77A|nr:hypothetical protein [Actinokineospora inagensis]